MRKNLVKHGNSMALVIEKPVLDLLGVSADTPFDIVTDGQALVLTPVRNSKSEDDFRAALKRGNQKYSATLKKLAE